MTMKSYLQVSPEFGHTIWRRGFCRVLHLYLTPSLLFSQAMLLPYSQFFLVANLDTEMSIEVFVALYSHML